MGALQNPVKEAEAPDLGPAAAPRVMVTRRRLVHESGRMDRPMGSCQTGGRRRRRDGLWRGRRVWLPRAEVEERRGNRFLCRERHHGRIP